MNENLTLNQAMKQAVYESQDLRKPRHILKENGGSYRVVNDEFLQANPDQKPIYTTKLH
mgnify:CR=1 FL=1